MIALKLEKINELESTIEYSEELLIKHAKDVIKRGDNLELAIISYTKAIEINPSNSKSYVERGGIFEHQKEFSKAISDYNKAIEQDPNNYDAYTARAFCKRNLEDDKGACLDYKKAASLGDKRAQKYLNSPNAYWCVSMSDNYSDLEKKYKEQINKGDLQEAISSINKLIEIEPENVYAYIDRGICNDELGNSESAIYDFNRAIYFDPKNYSAHYGLGVALRNSGDEEGAFNNFSKTINLNPEHTWAYGNRGNIKEALGNLKGACEDWKKAAELGDEDAAKLVEENCQMTENEIPPIETYQHRLNNLLSKFWEFTPFSASNPLPTMLHSKNEDGTLNFSYCPKQLEEESSPSKVSCFYTIQHDGKVKVKESKEILDLNDIAQTFAMIATIITDLYGTFDAESAHKKLMQKELPNIFRKDDTDRAVEFYDSGINKTKEGDYQGAIEDFSKAIEFDLKTGINKESSKLYFTRGFFKVKIEDFKGGITDLSKAIEIDPDYTLAYDNRGFAKNELEDFKGAIEEYDMSIKIDPNISNTYINRASSKKSLGDHKGALDDYAKAISLDPKSKNAYYNRALLNQKINDINGAINDYSKVIEYHPDYSNAYYHRGKILSDMNNLQGAIDDFEKIIEIGTDPDIAEIYRLIGVYKEELGDVKVACEYLKKASELGDEIAEDLFEDYCE